MHLTPIAYTHLRLSAFNRLDLESGMNLHEKYCDDAWEESDAVDMEFGKGHSDKGLVVWETGAGCRR